MSRVAARAVVPGEVDEVRALWFDLQRWPGFVDGFARVVQVDPGWPATGRLVWDSTPHGRGRVVEHAGGAVEDAKVAGTQHVSFEPHDAGVLVAVELDYRLKGRGPLTPLLDVLFVRRAMGDALERTVRRFAAEAQLDAELRDGEVPET